ncbi:hypothetical protein [Flavobacterium sp.]|uniref:glycoside hydrolase family 78 protein n=1 Tax=Flavobacterium sp. TaxID=239 RepID=UPI002CA0AC09|nr:hypothetical protein [Flavobacterium sp.]HSD08251.1 hypothetical protein [Flavobacterium sp.]
MKKFIYLSIIGFLVLSCSGIETLDPENTAPTTPKITAPTDNKLCVDNIVNFQWNASTDAENDAITYQIQVAKDNQFAQIVKTVEGTAVSQTITLDKNTAYYWRIKATDSKGLSSAYSATYTFYTSGDAVINHLPFAPNLLSPDLNAVLTTTTATLKWYASDVDATDVLTYDVYLGTVNPPTEKVGADLTSMTLDVPVTASKEYFWKVVVKDNKGGETVGQVWKFKTN